MSPSPHIQENIASLPVRSDVLSCHNGISALCENDSFLASSVFPLSLLSHQGMLCGAVSHYSSLSHCHPTKLSIQTIPFLTFILHHSWHHFFFPSFFILLCLPVSCFLPLLFRNYNSVTHKLDVDYLKQWNGGWGKEMGLGALRDLRVCLLGCVSG